MRWIWIDQAIEYERDERLVAVKLVSLAEEQMHAQFPADPELGEAIPVMPNTLILEGMAQTAGLLVGLRSRFAEKVVLAKITSAELDADVGPGEVIIYDARIDRYDGAGASTSGVVRRRRMGDPAGEAEQIGRVQMMFSHLDQNRSGLSFPEENFVFGELFKTFLRVSGLDHLTADAAAGAD
jgi:3-hydroxyacyl-[acyl-carrier-protein] dehydratase